MLNNKIPNLLKNAVELVSFTLAESKKFSLQEYAETFSDEIAEIVIRKQLEGVHFAKGTITITEINGMAFKPEVTLYFTTDDDNAARVIKSSSPVQTMTSCLRVDAIKTLKEQHEVLYEVNVS